MIADHLSCLPLPFPDVQMDDDKEVVALITACFLFQLQHRKSLPGSFDNVPSDCYYAIRLIDYFSKWLEVLFTSQVSTAMVIKFLLTVFSKEGNPKELMSDNRTNSPHWNLKLS